MGEFKATILKLGTKEGKYFLIVLTGDSTNEVEEATVLADAIENVRKKLKIPYFGAEKLIPFSYSSGPDPSLRSLLVIG